MNTQPLPDNCSQQQIREPVLLRADLPQKLRISLYIQTSTVKLFPILFLNWMMLHGGLSTSYNGSALWQKKQETASLEEDYTFCFRKNDLQKTQKVGDSLGFKTEQRKAGVRQIKCNRVTKEVQCYHWEMAKQTNLKGTYLKSCFKKNKPYCFCAFDSLTAGKKKAGVHASSTFNINLHYRGVHITMYLSVPSLVICLQATQTHSPSPDHTNIDHLCAHLLSLQRKIANQREKQARC